MNKYKVSHALGDSSFWSLRSVRSQPWTILPNGLAPTAIHQRRRPPKPKLQGHGWGTSFYIGVSSSVIGRGVCDRIVRSALETRISDRVTQNYVASDAFAYLTVVILLAAPLVVQSDSGATVLLLLVASLTVYLGSCAPPLLPAATVTPLLALGAPVLAAMPLLGLYAGQTMKWDVAIPYKLWVCGVGWLGLENIITNGLAGLRSLPLRAAAEARLISAFAALAIVLACLYSSGPLEVFASNMIAWSLALLSIRAVTIRSFPIAALLLVAFLCYDVGFVFGTDMMSTVVSQIEAPFAIRIAKSIPSESSAVTLGLGDIVIPGVAIAFFRRLEETLKGSYFANAMLSYVLGLVIAVLVNTFVFNGQPALLYIVPSVLVSALCTAAQSGEVQAILGSQPDVQTEVCDDVPGLSAGQFLVAQDGADDGMFGGAVLLVLEHDHLKGSMGIAVNRPLSEQDRESFLTWVHESLIFKDTAEQNAFQLLQGDVRVGGPVQIGNFPSQGSVVLHTDGSVQNAHTIIEASAAEGALFWSNMNDWDCSRSSQATILLIGLSAWGPGQLANEVRRGIWGLAPCSAQDVRRSEGLRQRLLEGGDVTWLRQPS